MLRSFVRHRVLLSVMGMVAVLGLFLLGGCSSFYPPLTDAAIRERFNGFPIPESRVVKVGDRQLHYVDSLAEGKPLVVFIHGSPGAWDAFEEFFKASELTERARIISVDRPGYGRSDLGIPERSLKQQASILSEVFQHNASDGGAILVGHSFGGPVAARMAIDYSEEVTGLVLVAASVDPELEETKWYQIPAHWKAFSWAVPRDLYSTNEEILPLAEELRGLDWPKLRAPTIVIQGGKDKLVPEENADFLERMELPAIREVQRYPELNHFVPWSRPELIIDAILDLLPARDAD